MIDLATVDSAIVAAVAEVTNQPTDAIHRDTSLEDLGVDSIARILVMRRVEQQCGLQFTSEHMLSFFKVNEISALGDLIRQYADRHR